MDPKQPSANGQAAPPPLTTITIVVTAEGTLSWQVQGQINRSIANGMLETAKQEIIEKLLRMERENAGKPPLIQDAPIGFDPQGR